MGVQPPPTGHLTQYQTALTGLQVPAQLIEQLFDSRLGQFQDFGQFADGHWRLGDEENGFNCCDLPHDAHSELRSTAPSPLSRITISANQSSWETSIRPHLANSSRARKYAATSTVRVH